MFVIVKVDGCVYVSTSSDEATAEEMADKTYEMLSSAKPKAMVLKLKSSGGFVVLGPEVMARAHIVYYDEKKEE